MNSTNAEQITLPIYDLLQTKNCGDVIAFRARWQTAVETVSRRALKKLRLEFAPLSERPTSTHRSNDNDGGINILRPSHLPVSA
jgi:hypothetical protein